MLVSSLNILLLSNAVATRRDKSILFSRTTILIFFYCLLLLVSNIEYKFLENNISLFGGLIFHKYYIQVFIGFLFLLVITIMTLTSFYPRKILSNKLKENFLKKIFNFKEKQVETKLLNNYITNILSKKGEQFKLIEYPLITLFVISGAIFLMSSNDLITIFLSIELQSYGLYIICTLYRNSELSTNAGLTYFLLGGLSSCIILLGQSLLYLNSGNTNLDGIYILEDIYENICSNRINEIYLYLVNYESVFYEDLLITVSHYSIQISLVIMSIGFLFKISAAPFHFWSPDVYDAVPTIVTTFIAIITKISILILLLELIYYTCNTILNWNNNLILSSLLSLIIGSVLGLSQFRIKRLYAYSTISHLGFILLALSISKIESIQAFFFYLIQYSVSNLNAFIILITIGYTFYNLIYKNNNILSEEKHLKDINYSPIQLISQLKGYFKINPLLSVSLSITLFSFIGVPPLIGFFGKQMVLSAALNEGYLFITFIAILTSVISAVYYLVLTKNIFFEESHYIANYNMYSNINNNSNNNNHTHDYLNISDYNINKINANESFTYKNINRQINHISTEINLINIIINKLNNNNYNNNNNIFYSYDNIKLSSSLTNIISVITIVILIFILLPKEFFNITIILSLLYYI